MEDKSMQYMIINYVPPVTLGLGLISTT